MEAKSVEIKILESTPEFIKVELPFLNVPVSMNYNFFKKRLDNGYFHILDSPKTASWSLEDRTIN